MFAFHETTRKRICRTAFFALCLAPTCATAAWIANHYVPWRDAAAARRLSDRYHLDVTLADWQDPRPNMTRLASVSFAEPGVAEPLLNFSQVETHRRGDVLIVSIDELSLRIAELPALAARLEWTLARTPAKKLELHIEKLTLQKAATGGRDPLTLHRLQGVIERTPQNHPRLRLLAHLAEQTTTAAEGEAPEATPPAPAKPIGLSVETVISANSPPRRVISLDTQQNAIPVALLAPLVPGAAALADSASFNGVVSWQVEQAPTNATTSAMSSVTGTLRGRLEQLDLAALLPPQSPHIFRGAATIELTEVRWQGEQLQHAAGRLTARDGEVNGAMLCAATRYLVCRLGGAFQALREAGDRAIANAGALGDESLLSAIHPVDQLACRFELDPSGFAMWGVVGPNEQIPVGCVIASGGQTLLLEPPFMPNADGTPSPAGKEVSKLPLVSWVQFAGSPVGAWIPFSPASLDIARRLPVQPPAPQQ